MHQSKWRSMIPKTHFMELLEQSLLCTSKLFQDLHHHLRKNYFLSLPDSSWTPFFLSTPYFSPEFTNEIATSKQIIQFYLKSEFCNLLFLQLPLFSPFFFLFPPSYSLNHQHLILCSVWQKSLTLNIFYILLLWFESNKRVSLYLEQNSPWCWYW